ncbi:hypothetical protein I41_08270 [Lacipirellula limnantheis]|uniref:Uncharacterized protein n=2 Tax=Lacipirellula limnantheis TaxID=2528024 RepID=A0A517TTG2_9BACT|nr:hypothetical protein I41_08270 [Lacipirellula limnantheis]
MWTTRSEKLTNARGFRFAMNLDSRPATFSDVIHGLQTDAAFRTLFNGLLADAPFSAFRWEAPAVTTAALSKPFEFVILDSPGLVRRPEPNAFAEHFNDTGHEIAVFTNLSKDAILIVPYPIAEDSAYGHLAAFVRFAPESQRQSLWREVGANLGHRVGVNSVWVSTAGAGVSWLHVRLDDRPKYYGFKPYM